MAKWVKGKYKIKTEHGFDEVEGAVYGQWGIDKRDGRYLLTHLPTGGFVESARTMTFLKKLVDTPEFQTFDGKNVAPLKDTIQRFRNEFGWKA